MPMMFGFGGQRKQMLEAELQRFIEEMPQLGMEAMYLIGPFARGEVDPATVLDLIVVQETDQPPHRRADFWTTCDPELAPTFTSIRATSLKTHRHPTRSSTTPSPTEKGSTVKST